MALSKLPTEEPGIPKWQIALAIGGTLAVGLGIYYYFTKVQTCAKIKKAGKKKSTGKTAADASENKHDVDLPDYREDDSQLTPLKRAQACKVKGNKLFKAGKYEEAIDCYDEAIEICPKEHTADLSTFYQNRAAAYEQLKNWENVMRDCTAALDLNDRYVKALQRRAKACEILSDLEQSLEDLTAVCIIESFQNQGTLMNVDRILKDLGRQHAKEAMEKREPIMPSKFFIKSYFESFIEDPIYNSLYKEKEGDVDESEIPPGKHANNNGYLLAKQHLRDGNYNEIIHCCTNELSNSLSPFAVEALLLRATMQLLCGEAKQALADFDTLCNKKDVSKKILVNALVKRATLHMQYERLSNCLQDFETAVSLQTDNADIYHHRGQIYLLIGKTDEAVDDFNQAVKLCPNFPVAVVQKCYTDYRLMSQSSDKSHLTKVYSQFEEAIRNFPKCSECYILYAQVLTDQQDYAKADECYQKALEIEPENPTTLVHRALLVLQWRGDLKEGKEMINKALEIDDQCELAYENMATIEVQTGNLKRGIELFEKAIPLAKTEMEMAHLFSLKDAAVAQLKIVEKMGITLPSLGTS